MLPVNWFMVMSNSRFWTGDGGSDGWEGRTGSHRGAKSSAALGQIERDAVPMRQEAPKCKRKARLCRIEGQTPIGQQTGIHRGTEEDGEK